MKQIPFILMVCGALLFSLMQASHAQQAAAALQGQVSSAAEGSMEGVLVSAKANGSTVTVTVVSNAQGRYHFPPGRLAPGAYQLSIRAVGYELDGSTEVQVERGGTTADLRLRETDNLAAQLTNAEWIMSMPGTYKQKRTFDSCVSCHTVGRIAQSTYTAEQFGGVLQRMAMYAQGAIPGHITMRPQAVLEDRRDAYSVERTAEQAEFLASINRSSGEWDYEFQTLTRPRGEATQVIYTEYDLPRPLAQPHDADVDSQGNIWYCDFGAMWIGVLNPETAEVKEYPLPERGPDRPPGCLDAEVDRQDNIWFGLMYGDGIAMFDPVSEEFTVYKSPGETDEGRMAMVAPQDRDVDGKVWVGGTNEYQVDLDTNTWTAIDYLRDVSPDSHYASRRRGAYDAISDSKNNFYGLELGDTHIFKVDAKTLTTTFYPTPTPNSGPRRGYMDAQDRLWFGEFRGNNIGMLNTVTEEFREWQIPMPWTSPYDAVLDNTGYAWGGGMHNDRVARLNTETGMFTMYLLPHSTNIRRVAVDNATNPPTFWIGNNHGATLIKLEPLDQPGAPQMAGDVR